MKAAVTWMRVGFTARRHLSDLSFGAVFLHPAPTLNRRPFAPKPLQDRPAKGARTLDPGAIVKERRRAPPLGCPTQQPCVVGQLTEL